MLYRRWRSLCVLPGIFCLGALLCLNISGAESHWWKGNLHTHTLWSDGDEFPELVTDWYKTHGYNFLAISDHDDVHKGERWINPDCRPGTNAFAFYLKRYGTNQLDQRRQGNVTRVRLKRLEEFRGLAEESGRFLLMEGEEITDSLKALPVHMNAINLREAIKPCGGSNVLDIIERDAAAVRRQQEESGCRIILQLNHPNYRWAVKAEEIMQVRNLRFIEIYNGYCQTQVTGDKTHASVERLWDIALTWRLGRLGLGPLYGTAGDDAHYYHNFAPELPNPGRGWIMAQSAKLTPEDLLRALESGDFYASTGVQMQSVTRGKDILALEVKPELGVKYRIQFIGTRRGFNAEHHPLLDAGGKPLPVTEIYSAEVGVVLAEANGAAATYKMKGDELYVRARVISSKPKANPSFKDEKEMAWIQPLVPERLSVP